MKGQNYFDGEIGLKAFCNESKIGTYRCGIITPYGWQCDFCLYDELMWLNKNGVKTVNSCCGHGNNDLSFILVIGEESKLFMENHDYKRNYRANNSKLEENQMTEWIPKTKFPYN